MNRNNKWFLVFIAILLAGCAAKALNPGASKVLVNSRAPNKTCKFLGQVHGNQGDFWTGEFTSYKNLEIGAMNDIRNQAHALGANFVELQVNRAGVDSGGAMYGNGGNLFGGGTIAGGSYSTQVSTVIIGNAYYCSDLR